MPSLYFKALILLSTCRRVMLEEHFYFCYDELASLLIIRLGERFVALSRVLFLDFELLCFKSYLEVINYSLFLVELYFEMFELTIELIYFLLFELTIGVLSRTLPSNDVPSGVDLSCLVLWSQLLFVYWHI